MFLCTWSELCRLLVTTPFEAFLSVIAWFLFSIMATIKLEKAADISWAKVFIPLFVNVGVSAYLTTIVIVRRIRQGVSRPILVAFREHIASILSLVLTLVTEIFLVQKLDGYTPSVTYIQLFVPLYCWFTLLLVFYCAGCSRRCS